MEKIQLENLGDFKKTGNPYQVRYCCPYCSEDKYKFYVHIRKGVFICHRCKVKGKIGGITSVLDSFKERVDKFLHPERYKKESKQLRLPREFISPIRKQHGMPWRYLRNRGVTYEQMDYFNIGYCSDGPYAERIVVPVYDDDDLLYFVGRTYTNRIPKYMNAESHRASVIFKTFAKKVKEFVIVEGIFDALRVGKVFPTVALLGKEMSGEQALKISELGRLAYVMLDPDAKDYGWRIAKDLSYYMKTKFVPLTHKDPGEMKIHEVKMAIWRGGSI